MTKDGIVNLIKNYEEELKNYSNYMLKITSTLMSNPLYIMEIKIQIKTDQKLRSRIKELSSTSNGAMLKRMFKEICMDNKKR